MDEAICGGCVLRKILMLVWLGDLVMMARYAFTGNVLMAVLTLTLLVFLTVSIDALGRE